MVSVFTPTHDTKFLADAYASLRAQTDADWEWIILLNNGAVDIGFDDPRVKVHRASRYVQPWVGPLKAAACDHASGDVLLELDHDDLLMPSAIAEVRAAFDADPAVGFVYSNTIHCDYSRGEFQKIPRFDECYGWRYRDVIYDGHALDEHVSFPPTPESISRIWFAPNHLRAMRRQVYEAVGGYSKDMRILDDLDLMCRMYARTRFCHIDRGLYVYRVHGENSWLRYNAEIQQNVYRIYDQYIMELAEAWAGRNSLRLVEVGGRMAARGGYKTVDKVGPADILCDLNDRWPFEDNTVGVVRAFDVFEHLRDPIHTMRELSRVLAPGGWAFVQVPSTDGRGAFQDPTHVSFWNENSFAYYTDARKAKYIDTPVRFQAPRLYTTDKNSEGVCWTVAHLLNLKDGYRPAGLVSI